MSPQDNCSLIESLALLSDEEQAEALAGFTEEQCTELLYDWRANARPSQLRPAGNWLYWLVLAGRGFGKTRTGGETVREWVSEGYRRIHLIGPTVSDVRNVMIEHPESGILRWFPPHEKPVYEPTKHLLYFHNGAVAETFSADEPERLRGPQCEAFWADELCAWRFLKEAWDNLNYGFRIGNRLRAVITTTPKPSDTLREIIRDPDTVITRGSSYENRSNLAAAYFKKVIAKHEGTRIGRQEIYAEVLEDTPGALWTIALIEKYRVNIYNTDDFVRVVIPIDPAVSIGEDSADTGIVPVALRRDGHVMVLEDLTCHESPLEWARIAVSAYHRWRADRIVGEVNNGGDLVEANIRAVAPNVSFRSVRASRGKAVRAEPIAALYEQGRVHHVGNLPDLEAEMTTYVPMHDMKSPDRMDALVWGITELLIDLDDTPQWSPAVVPVRISRY
jgi:phage terminase large subunit-like protein